MLIDKEDGDDEGCWMMVMVGDGSWNMMVMSDE